MMRWLCFFHVGHKWRYLGDFTRRQCKRCKCRQWAWPDDTGYTWISGTQDQWNLNGKAANKETGVWFSQEPRPIMPKVTRSSRIGVCYAGPIWSLKPYRFTLD